MKKGQRMKGYLRLSSLMNSNKQTGPQLFRSVLNSGYAQSNVCYLLQHLLHHHSRISGAIAK